MNIVLASAGELAIEFNLPPAIIIGVLVSIILPLFVGLITKVVTHPGVKAVLLAAASALTGLLTELGAAVSAGVAYNLGNGLLLALVAFLVATGTYYGIWKPTNVANKLQKVGTPTQVLYQDTRGTWRARNQG